MPNGGTAAGRELQPLGADGPAQSARALVERLGLAQPVGARPRVVAAMIASADGRAQLQDRSVGLGNPADRALLRELRTGTDVVLAGARTLLAERYATLLDPEQQAYRGERGLPPHPVVATVSRDLAALPADRIPLFGEPGVPIVVGTESASEDPLGACTADVSAIRFPPGGLTFPGFLGELRARHGARSVSCEGGPSLLRELLAQGCVDELLLTVAPKLVAGDRLAVLEGAPLGPRGLDLDLLGVHRAGDHLFLHYRPRDAG